MIEKRLKLKNNIEINLKDNQKDKPALLFLHFNSANLHMWNGLIPHFKDDYRLLMPDLRGHGKSSKPDQGYRIEDMALDMQLLLKKLKVDSLYLIGSSMGAEVGTVLAAESSNRVKAIINEGALYKKIGKNSIKGDDINQTEKINEKLNEIDKRKEEYYQTAQEYIETQKRFFQRAGLWNDNFEIYIENNVCKTDQSKYRSCHPVYASKEYLKNYFNFDLAEYYKKINCPVLFLPDRYEWENENIKASIESFGKLAGHYEIKILKGFIHEYGWMNVPKKTAQMVQGFIKKY